MDRRKQILVNRYEVASHEALLEASARSGAQVFPKVRLADALAIGNSGLSDQEFSYALKAHFDFVVQRPGTPVAFAVEFDGPHHHRDPKTIVNDGVKNAICDKLGMPLLRIDGEFLRRIGRFTILGWLAEIWFLGEDFTYAQERGDIAPDEFFDPRMILFEFENPSENFPYDPFLRHRAYIAKMAKQGHWSYPGEEIVAVDPHGYVVALIVIDLTTGGSIIGVGRCRDFHFWTVSAFELAQDLAAYDAAEKLRAFLRDEKQPATGDELLEWRQMMRSWERYR